MGRLHVGRIQPIERHFSRIFLVRVLPPEACRQSPAVTGPPVPERRPRRGKTTLSSESGASQSCRRRVVSRQSTRCLGDWMSVCVYLSRPAVYLSVLCCCLPSVVLLSACLKFVFRGVAPWHLLASCTFLLPLFLCREGYTL